VARRNSLIALICCCRAISEYTARCCSGVSCALDAAEAEVVAEADTDVVELPVDPDSPAGIQSAGPVVPDSPAGIEAFGSAVLDDSGTAPAPAPAKGGYRYRAIVSHGDEIREVASTRLNEEIFQQIRAMALAGKFDNAAQLLADHSDIGLVEARDFVAMIEPEN